MIEDKDIERLKEIFVTKEKCQEDMAVMDEKVVGVKLTLERINTKVSIIMGICSASGVAILGAIVTAIAKIVTGG